MPCVGLGRVEDGRFRGGQTALFGEVLGQVQCGPEPDGPEEDRRDHAYDPDDG